jgi:hypothetical protein
MVSKWMGHAKIETTAIYCNAVGEEQQRGADVGVMTGRLARMSGQEDKQGPRLSCRRSLCISDSLAGRRKGKKRAIERKRNVMREIIWKNQDGGGHRTPHVFPTACRVSSLDKPLSFCGIYPRRAVMPGILTSPPRHAQAHVRASL